MAGEIISVSELESYCKLGFDSEASVVAAMVIDGCQGSLESWLQRPVTVRDFEEQILLNEPTPRERMLRTLPDTTQPIYLTYTPVVEVSSVKLDDVVQDAAGYTVRSFGLSGLAFWGDMIEIAYKAGWDGLHRDHSVLRFNVLRAAKREMNHYLEGDSGLDEIQSERYSVKFTEPESVFTERELGMCFRYKRKTAMLL